MEKLEEWKAGSGILPFFQFSICSIYSILPALLALPTFSKELKRVANFRVPVAFFDLALNFLYRTGINHHGDISAFGANNMIVVLLRIEKFVVTARPVQMNLLRYL